MGEWIKIRAGLRRNIRVFHMARELSVTPDELIARLYDLASWFAAQGEYGKMTIEPNLIDLYSDLPGLAVELMEADWLRDHDGTLCLHWFCDVSSKRKALGKKIRSQVLDGAVCACCGTPERLVIDHIIPIVRGGSCELTNLQALCWHCNVRKGRKTMEEFMAGEAA